MDVKFSAAAIKNRDLNKILKSYIIALILSLILVLALSVSIFKFKNYLIYVHTFLELVCIFTALCIFLVVWLTDGFGLPINRFMGFGFLAVSIFNSLHTFHFSESVFLYDKSIRYGLLSSFIQALTLLFFTFKTCHTKLSKLCLLFLTLMLSLYIIVLFEIFGWLFPVLYNGSNFTAVKVFSEFIIIAMLIVILYRIQKNIYGESIFANNNTYLSIMFAISSEICLTFHINSLSFFNLLGLLFKLTSYFYLLIGIFKTSIIYPYVVLKEVKQQVDDSQKNILDTFNQLPFAIINYDDNAVISFANQKAAELFECEIQDIIGLTSEQFRANFKDNKPTDQSIVLELIKNPKSYIDNINKYRTKKGKTLNLRVAAFAHKHGILTVYENIKKEQEISELKLQTYTILDSISDLVIMIDSNYKIIHCNKAFLECAEIQCSDIIGKDVRDIALILRYKINGELYSPTMCGQLDNTLLEASIVTLTGKTKYLLQRSSRIVNVDNEIIGYINILTDITKLNEEEEWMKQQEKMALIGLMGSGIVHETKNLLAGIKGYCQLLLLKTQDDVTKKYIHRIDNIADDANKVIAEFLNLAKPSDNIMDITSLNEIIMSMRYMLESPSFIKNIKITINLTDEDKDIKADDSQIKQVILNLVKNAVEAMSETPDPHLIISTKYNKIKNEMLLTISDNGNGISKENLTKLWIPFFTTKASGTGLGLSTSYKIIYEHGGHIYVESELGKGSTFTISLPCYESA